MINKNYYSEKVNKYSGTPHIYSKMQLVTNSFVKIKILKRERERERIK